VAGAAAPGRPENTEPNEIRLVIPATAEYVRLARLTVAGLASRMGFTFDEVEDLRIAVDELHHCLLGSSGSEATLTLTCAIRPEGLEVEGVASFGPDGAPPAPKLSDFSTRILRVVVDEYECNAEEPQPSFRLLKRHSRDE
jgi:serine/threonine-protein kinase RsbW